MAVMNLLSLTQYQKSNPKEGDIVLDPTMGSGSTGEACRNMNREFIGIEMDDEYFELCCGRLDE